MIISASYKTDIPAFYGEWFLNRIRAGYCKMVNPYNKKQHQLISLREEDVDGFIFWTKNLTPFVDTLDEVYRQGFPFIVQYTINGYPRAFEARVVDADKSVENFLTASEKYGSMSVVWRYDTIIFSTITDSDFHRKNFADLASKLAGATDEVVVSFVQLYKKTRTNMNGAARTSNFDWYDPPAEDKRELLGDLVEIANRNDIRLSICTQPELRVPGAGEASCIDAERLMGVAGRPFQSRVKGVRAGCACYESKDIGDYDTCPHGCVYCYAVSNRSLALRRYQNHDPQGEYLFPQKPLPTPSVKFGGNAQREQLSLFSHISDEEK